MDPSNEIAAFSEAHAEATLCAASETHADVSHDVVDRCAHMAAALGIGGQVRALDLIEVGETEVQLGIIAIRCQAAKQGYGDCLHRLCGVVDEQNRIRSPAALQDMSRNSQGCVGSVAQAFAVEQDESGNVRSPFRFEWALDTHPAHDGSQKAPEHACVVADEQAHDADELGAAVGPPGPGRRPVLRSVAKLAAHAERVETL